MRKIQIYFLEEKEGDRVLEKVAKIVNERLPKRFGYNPLKDIQVLSPMNRGRVGTRKLNEKLQEVLGISQIEVTRGGRGEKIETRTYSAAAFTKRSEAEKCGAHLFGLGEANYRRFDITEWYKIKRMQEPTIISANKDGEFVIIVPKGQQAEFYGALGEGNFIIDGKEGDVIQTPIKLDRVVELNHPRRDFPWMRDHPEICVNPFFHNFIFYSTLSLYFLFTQISGRARFY